MREELVKNAGKKLGSMTRREILKAAALSTLSGGLSISRALAHAQEPPRDGGAAPPDYEPNWLTREPRQARIVDISSASVVQGAVVNPIVLEDVFGQGLLNLTDEKTPARAWRSILGDARRIVLKFNSVGADTLKTNDTLAVTLVDSLVSGGFERADLALVEVSDAVRKQTSTGVISDGWREGIAIAGDTDSTRQYLSEADAIINVPFLKTHQIAGMSCCMKNISHAIVRHPARYHGDGCSPYIGRILGCREVGSKLKLNIINALRVVIDHGPDAREQDIVDFGGLFFGYDPVAMDTIGLSVLEMERRRAGRHGALLVRYLPSAAEMQLGRWRVSDIERVTVQASS